MFNTFIQTCNTTLIDYDTITFGEFIDSGSSGKVYEAKLKPLAQDIFIEDKSVTIKCFSLNNYHSEYGFIDDVEGELKIYQRLVRSKHCCELIGYSYSRLNGGLQLYIIMKDYGVEGDLDAFKNQEKYWSKLNDRDKNNLEENEYYYKYQRHEWVYDMNYSTKISITKGLCLAIEELHSRDIVHCDMKPGNVLYNDKIILIDFGASHHINKETKIMIDEDMGTLGYACSELNSGICSKRSDIYSLAITILEIWVGDIWNEGVSHKECRNEVLSSLRYLSKKEPTLSKILRSCTVLNVNKRPSIQTLKKNLFEIFN